MFLSDVGGVGGILSTLKEFKVSESAIASIKMFLEAQEQALAENADKRDAGDQSMFGVGWSGVYLGTHQAKADAYLTNTIVETAAALNLMMTAMTDFAKDVSLTVAEEEARDQQLLGQLSQADDLKDDDQNTPADGNEG